MRSMLGMLALAMGLASPDLQCAEGWPTRTITIVAPGGAGGTSDIFARLLAAALSKELATAVIVENRPGAGINVGTAAVARAKPDGYTLLIGAAALTMSPHLSANAGFDPLRDFQPVRLIARFPNVVVVSPAGPLRSVSELITQARANPGRFNYAAPPGTSVHLSTELFKSMTGTEIVHVPYKSSALSAMAVVTGDVLVAFENMPVVLPLVKAGKLRAVAVTSATRSSSLPDVPTVMESGVKGYEVSTWFGLLAPAGTPTEIIRALDEATRRFLASAQARDALLAMGAEPADEGPAAFAQLIRNESEKWGAVIRKANVTAD